jgi:predicted AAA+ superfamily ATPase
MTNRSATGRVRAAMMDRPVVLIHGARQTGKTTLVRALAQTLEGALYVTFDDLTTLAAARSYPEGFLAGIEGTAVLDEVQRAPDALVAIKAAVDRMRTPGRFLLTGSANVLLLPHIAESLAGRMEIVTLWPFSQGEMEGVREGFVDAVFGMTTPRFPMADSNGSLVERILQGGYPEAVASASKERRSAWFDAYILTILQRDIRDIANIAGLTEMPRLLSLLAARPMSVLNYAELSRTIGFPQSTLKRYFALLEMIFLVRTIPPWHANIGKRLVKSPKVMLCDTGLAAHLSGMDAAHLSSDRTKLGGLLENFVALEIIKQQGWSNVGASLFHFRTHEGQEVDLVLERRSGEIVGVEVKGSATVSASDFTGLRVLAQASGKRFHRGIVLYTGREIVSFGSNLWAVPMEGLWRWGAGSEGKKHRTQTKKKA